jgi:hypothetical protein
MTRPVGFRSGLTEGPVTTRPGTIIFDAGMSLRRISGGSTFRVGELDVRVPLSARVEARLYANSFAWRQAAGRTTSGREQAALASAVMLTSHAGFRPVTTLVLRVDMPTATLPGVEQSWRPSARLAVGWELPGRLALHGNLGVSREVVAGQAFARGLASVWLSRRVTGRVDVYGEVLASTREQPGGSMTGYLHGGVAYLVAPSLHLDAHVGVGSRSAGSPSWAGVGLRQRW